MQAIHRVAQLAGGPGGVYTSLQPLLVCSQYISKSVQNSGGGSLLQTSGGCRPVVAAANTSLQSLLVVDATNLYPLNISGCRTVVVAATTSLQQLLDYGHYQFAATAYCNRRIRGMPKVCQCLWLSTMRPGNSSHNYAPVSQAHARKTFVCPRSAAWCYL